MANEDVPPPSFRMLFVLCSVRSGQGQFFIDDTTPQFLKPLMGASGTFSPFHILLRENPDLEAGQ